MNYEETDTVAAENIHSAKELLPKGGVSLVILDVNLPDGNGFDFLPIIKKEYGIPVIMLRYLDIKIFLRFSALLSIVLIKYSANLE